MILSWWSFIIIAILNLVLAFLVLTQKSYDKVNRSFFWMTLFSTIWIASNYLENASFKLPLRSFFLKLDFATAPLLAFLFLLFCINFSEFSFKKSIKNGLLIIVFIFVLSSFSNYLIKEIRLINEVIVFNTAWLFLPYALFIIGSIGFGCCALAFSYRNSIGIRRIQHLYILTGLTITAVVIIVLNLILPQIVFIPLSMGRLGTYSLIFFIFFTTVAIIRYRLFEIRIVLTSLLVGAIAILLSANVADSQTNFEYIWKVALLIAFLLFGYLLIKSVLNEIKRREELQRLYEEVDRLSRSKSEFISIASHQLRTPLTAIKGYISMVLDKTYGEVPKSITKALKNVGASNERLIKLVNDLLSISRIEAGRMEIKMENLSVEDIITSVVEELKNIVKEKGLYLKFEKPKIALPKILIDGDKIRQVILNLTDNAIKYTRGGGITIKLEIENLKLKIIVSDTGEGMTKEEMSKMFESFSRGSAGTRLYTEGAGLGLYIAKKFVEIHKGKIWTESQGRGKGSTFYIELPVK